MVLFLLLKLLIIPIALCCGVEQDFYVQNIEIEFHLPLYSEKSPKIFSSIATKFHKNCETDEQIYKIFFYQKVLTPFVLVSKKEKSLPKPNKKCFNILYQFLF